MPAGSSWTADPGASIKATLIWGKGPGDRQTVDVPAQKDWSKTPIAFTAQADTADGRIEIVGTGSGSFRIGAVSLMPTTTSTASGPTRSG